MKQYRKEKNRIDIEKYIEAEEQLARSMAKMKLYELNN